jgi:hypothetical protein
MHGVDEQPVPSVSDEDVIRIVRRDFPQPLHAAVLESQIEIACEDYRDVIAPAEYPAYSRHSAGKSLTVDKRAILYAADWAQYTAWLYG